MIERPRASAITGRGAVSSLGADRGALWESISRGDTGIAPITRFDTSGFGVRTGAQVVANAFPDYPALMGERDAAAAESFCLALSARALREALDDAGLLDHASGQASARGIALIFGTGLAELERPLHEMVAELADRCGLDGPRLTISTACSSSTSAIGFGLELLSLGAADIVVAGGADVLTPEVFAGFHALGVLTRTACAPFSTPAGTTLGEGAGFLVLERESAARQRGASVHALIAGHGLSCDAWHETSPDPTGTGITRAIRSALEDAGVAASAIDYVNAHGSGTQSNDSAEWVGIRRALADRADVPVSSTKGALGHAQGAAGVLEAIVTLEALRHGMIPPTINFAGPRPHAPLDPVPGPRPRIAEARRVVSVNAAFGGANAALVLVHGVPVPTVVRTRRRVLLRTIVRAEPTDPVDRSIPTDELRRADPSARALTAAAARALHTGAWPVVGERRFRTGLFVGQRRTSPASLRAFAESIAAHGLVNLSTSAFARIVLNAAAGTCARLLSLRGPHTALTTGAASGLTALILAAELVATRHDVDAMLAAGVDEWSDESRDATELAPRDAAMVALVTAVGDEAAAGTRISGWGIAGPTSLEQAVALAAPDGLPPETLVLAADDNGTGACSALERVSEAVQAIQSGAATHALVTTQVPGAMSAAILFSR